MIIQIIFILILFSILSALVTNQKNHLLFAKAAVIGLLWFALSYLALIISTLMTAMIFELLHMSLGSYFLTGIVIILLAGVLELLLIKSILYRQKIDNELIVVFEHFVQWALVYFVIYQTITQKFNEDVLKEFQFQNIFDPTYLNVAILPSLIVTWIAIFSYRIKQN
ncbi:TPA: hypothetical protein R1936_002114 [Staphylococcus delphini]|nr:hypothetical protein [Staphylococcus delphini]HEC2148925.1 hypothetical protein [Staphylococcus delphini]HEC2171778.1 hypothetical protein [Staphylococcus delphini]HEC2192054.1 hypothetical protein [Staphylococcus delphini]HEC2208033.1 hypothetical protein [Staphylococcus delphini]